MFAVKKRHFWRPLEGKPGEPKPRPPFPAVKGLFGKPTNINNVETWSNIPLIINNGPEFIIVHRLREQ